MPAPYPAPEASVLRGWVEIKLARASQRFGLSDGAVDSSGDLPKLLHELFEFMRVERLWSVGKGCLRVVMHLDDEAVRSSGDGCSRHG